MTCTYVDAEIITWRCLEEGKNLLSAWPFSLYNRFAGFGTESHDDPIDTGFTKPSTKN